MSRNRADGLRWRKALVGAATFISIIPALPVAVTTAMGATTIHRCSYAQLEVAIAWGPGGYAGTEASPFLVANTGLRACSLKGFPSLRFFTSLPTPAKVRVAHSASQIFADPNPRLVVIRPGQVASFGLSYSDAFSPRNDNPKSCVSSTVDVSLPVTESNGRSYEDDLTFDLCQSNMRVSVTPIELGPTPLSSQSG